MGTGNDRARTKSNTVPVETHRLKTNISSGRVSVLAALATSIATKLARANPAGMTNRANNAAASGIRMNGRQHGNDMGAPAWVKDLPMKKTPKPSAPQAIARGKYPGPIAAALPTESLRVAQKTPIARQTRNKPNSKSAMAGRFREACSAGIIVRS